LVLVWRQQAEYGVLGGCSECCVTVDKSLIEK